jgi:hypothetical protein
MKPGMIFARKTTWRSRLDLEYLDETSGRKASSRQQHDGPRDRSGSSLTRPQRKRLGKFTRGIHELFYPDQRLALQLGKEKSFLDM